MVDIIYTTPAEIVQVVTEITQVSQITTPDVPSIVSVITATPPDIISELLQGPQGIPGPSGGAGSTLLTRLDITGSKPASSIYSVTSSGVDYTKSGDNGSLMDSEALFNAASNILIVVNGVYQTKGAAVTWLSPTSFQLDAAVDNGDEIIIIS
jgi:hypothetical protein